MSQLPAHWVDGPAGAPAVILLHPIATNSRIWAAQASVWAHRFRVVRIDLPGHGRSAVLATSQPVMRDYADAVSAVCDALGLDRVAIVGLSLGGMVAQAFALARPQCVTALVLAHTSAQTTAAVRDVWSERLAACEKDGLPAQVEPTLQRWFTPGFLQRAPTTAGWVGDQIRSTAPAGYIAAIRAIQALDHGDRLKDIVAPTLVVAGAQDAAIPPAAAAAIAQRIAGARLAVLEDAAHLGNVEQAVAFTETVGRFLQEVLATEETS